MSNTWRDAPTVATNGRAEYCWKPMDDELYAYCEQVVAFIHLLGFEGTVTFGLQAWSSSTVLQTKGLVDFVLEPAKGFTKKHNFGAEWMLQFEPLKVAKACLAATGLNHR